MLDVLRHLVEHRRFGGDERADTAVGIDGVRVAVADAGKGPGEELRLRPFIVQAVGRFQDRAAVSQQVERAAEAGRPVAAAVNVAAGLAGALIHVPARAGVDRHAIGRVPGVLGKDRLARVLRGDIVAVAVGVVRMAGRIVVKRDAVVVAVAVPRRAVLELGAELQLVPAELVGVVGYAAVDLVARAIGIVKPALRLGDQTIRLEMG